MVGGELLPRSANGSVETQSNTSTEWVEIIGLKGERGDSASIANAKMSIKDIFDA